MIEGSKNRNGKLITVYGQDPARVTDLIQSFLPQFQHQFPPVQWLTYHLNDSRYPTEVYQLNRLRTASRVEVGVPRHIAYEPLLNSSLSLGVNIVAENYVDQVIAAGGRRFDHPVRRSADLNLILGEASAQDFRFLPRSTTRVLTERYSHQQTADALRYITQVVSQIDALVVHHHQRRFQLPQH